MLAGEQAVSIPTDDTFEVSTQSAFAIEIQNHRTYPPFTLNSKPSMAERPSLGSDLSVCAGAACSRVELKAG